MIYHPRACGEVVANLAPRVAAQDALALVLEHARAVTGHPVPNRCLEGSPQTRGRKRGPMLAQGHPALLQIVGHAVRVDEVVVRDRGLRIRRGLVTSHVTVVARRLDVQARRAVRDPAASRAMLGGIVETKGLLLADQSGVRAHAAETSQSQ